MMVVQQPMSHRHVTRDQIMAHVQDDSEQASRMMGLFAMLALSPVRLRDGTYRRRRIEIEISPNNWAEITGAAIEPDRFLCWSGSNGTRRQYPFRRSEGIPRWRVLDDHTSETR